MKTYSISEVAKHFDVAPHTLRYYDKEGLLPYVERTESGNRVFKDKDFAWLQIVNCLKDTGVSIKQIKEYLVWCQIGDPSLETRLQFMLEHKKNIQNQIDELKKCTELIDFKIWYYETAIEAGTADINKMEKSS